MRWASRISGMVLGAAVLSGTALADDMVSYDVVDGGIPKSLTGTPGDVEAGKKAIINRKLGNCLACHEVTAMQDQPFHGNIGPSLDGVAERYDEAQLRLILVDSKQVFDGTIMPGFYRMKGLNRVGKKFEGKTILTAQEVEDVVAYLKTLK